MSIFVGDTAPSKIFVGDTEVSKVFVGDTQVRPSGWKPGANTIAYFPLENDKSNAISGSNIALSTSTTTISTIGGVNCLYCDGTQQQTINIGFRTEDIGSVMLWYYSTDNSGVRTYIGEYTRDNYDNDRSLVSFNGTLRYSRLQDNVYADIDTTLPSANQWHCIGITEGSGGGKLFLDGILVGSNSTTMTYSKLTTKTGVGVSYKANDNTFERQIKGYMSKIVINNNDITLSDYLDFYNLTKSNYGL